MRLLLLLLSFAICGYSQGSSPNEYKKKYAIESITRVESIEMDEAEITFVIKNGGIFTDAHITYSIDRSDVNAESDLDAHKTFSSKVIPGKHRFIFHVNSRFKEMKTGNIEARGGHRTTVILNFKEKHTKNYQGKAKRNQRRRERWWRKQRRKKLIPVLEKPVIYLYPEKKMEISVKLEVTGELTFSYPEYENGWIVEADERGTITHNNTALNYLFWEADYHLKQTSVDESKGFIVSGDSVTSFLENSLATFGFTTSERADFITYWAPTLKNNSNLYICFEFNDDCNTFADLHITPEPDIVARFYMLWAPISESIEASSISAQEIPTMNRNGFVVLEWGGMEIELKTLTDLN